MQTLNSKTNATLIAGIVALSIGITQTASADSCLLQGYSRVESQDTYYCDTDHLGSAYCSGWKQVDIDGRGSNAEPMRYMMIRIREPSGALLKQAYTNDNGFFSTTFTVAGSCAGHQVKLERWMKRVLGDDVHVTSNPRFRFEVTNSAGTVWHNTTTVTLGGYWTQHNQTVAATTGLYSRAASIYQTVDSMVSEVVWWSSKLNASFIGTDTGTKKIFKAKLVPTGKTGWETNAVVVQKDDAFEGFKIRHEIGHSLHSEMHDDKFKFAQDDDSCVNSNHAGNGGHLEHTCEWGSKAMKEGMADFIALRSVTSNDTNGWTCACNADPGRGHGQDVCSLLASGPGFANDADALLETVLGSGGACKEGHLRGVGDDYANDTDSCVALRQSSGCDCNNSTCEESFRLHHGWKNSTQVVRFLWDMIDSNNEGGMDNTDLSMQQFVALIENMPCTGTDWGVNGSCNEPNRKIWGYYACLPYDPTTTDGLPHASTRHSYNVWDIGLLVPGNQTDERVVNCVDGAR